MNSTTSALALRILPEIPPVVFSHIHELDAAFTYWFPQPERDAMLAHTHWYVACAEAVASYLIGHQGVAPERVSCHYEFIDLPRADPDRAAALRESLGIGPKSLVVGGSGLKIWRKAPDLFLQAANTLVRERPDLDVHFVWVGGDAHYDQMPIERDIARMGLSGRAHFVGEVAKPADLFSTFDVFCLTSREDPFPLVMLEAASLGVPIVSFPNGGAMELAGYQDGDPDHRRAVIVDYLDTDAMARAVTHLLDDAEEREVLGKRGQQWVELEHTVDAAGPRLYEAIMSRLGGRGPDANDGPPPGDEPPVDALQLTEQHRHFAGLRADRWALRR